MLFIFNVENSSLKLSQPNFYCIISNSIEALTFTLFEAFNCSEVILELQYIIVLTWWGDTSIWNTFLLHKIIKFWQTNYTEFQFSHLKWKNPLGERIITTEMTVVGFPSWRKVFFTPNITFHYTGYHRVCRSAER